MTHMHKHLDAERRAQLAADSAERPGLVALADFISKHCRGCTHPSICDSHGCGNEQAKPAPSGLHAAATRALAAWDSTVLPAVNDGRLQEAMECLRAEVTP